MLIHLKTELVWSNRQQKYIRLRDSSINWTGSVSLVKGASTAQTDLANQQSSFYTNLNSDFNQQFANQSSILKSLTNSLSPILNGGPNQFGFSTAQTNNLNSQALQGTGQAYANAAKNLKESQAAQGGGNVSLPNGANNQQQAALAAGAANQQSNQLLGIQQQGYEQGRQNFNNAVGQLGGVASQYNPTGFAGQATSAGSAAASTANQITQENNAASPWNFIGGILGGAASGLAGGLTSKLFSGGGNGGGGGFSAPQLGSFGPAQGDNTNWAADEPLGGTQMPNLGSIFG